MRGGRLAVCLLSAVLLAGALWWARDSSSPGPSVGGAPQGGLPEVPAPGGAALGSRPTGADPIDPRRDSIGRADTARRLRILVWDVLGSPIAGATIDGLDRHGKRLSLGLTSTGGVGEIAIEDDAELGQLMVRAAGHATAFVPVPEMEVDELHVRLEFAGRISGTVRTPGGSPVGAGLMVLAVPLGYSGAGAPTTEQAARCIHGRSAGTLHDGSFEIDGLQEGSPYRLEVASEVWAARHTDRNTLVTASADGVSIQVHDLYGSILEFSCVDPAWLGPDFSPPAGSTHQRGARAFERLAFWDGSIGIRHGNPSLAAAGAHELPLLFVRTEPGDTDTHGIEYRCTIPGFAPVSERIEIRALRLGSLPVHRIELLPTAQGFGSLEVELEGPGVELLSKMRVQGYLRLTPEAGGSRLSFPLTWDAQHGRSALAPHVPAGVYRWALSLGMGWLEVGDVPGSAPTSDTVEVWAADVSRIVARLPGLSYLELTCGGSPGAAGAELVLAKGPHFTRGMAEELQTFVCGEGAQLLGPLPPGHYEVGAQQPSELVGGPLVLVLEPGELRSVTLVLK